MRKHKWQAVVRRHQRRAIPASEHSVFRGHPRRQDCELAEGPWRQGQEGREHRGGFLQPAAGPGARDHMRKPPAVRCLRLPPDTSRRTCLPAVLSAQPAPLVVLVGSDRANVLCWVLRRWWSLTRLTWMWSPLPRASSAPLWCLRWVLAGRRPCGRRTCHRWLRAGVQSRPRCGLLLGLHAGSHCATAARAAPIPRAARWLTLCPCNACVPAPGRRGGRGQPHCLHC